MAMRVFSASLEEFQRKVMTNQIFRDLEAGFRGVVGHTVAPSEASAWRGSLPRLEAALRLAELRGDVHVTLEERIPYFSKRIDACLFGHDQDGSPYTVVVELKGWAEAEARDDVSVETFLGGADRIEPHPSAQVQGYHQHLVDYRRAFHSPGALSIASCAYCHNYPGIEPDEGLFHPRFDVLRDHSPTFGERDAELLAKYLRVRLERGHGSAVLDVYDRRGVGPSKSLVDHADRMIREQGVFRLLDEQLVANSAIMRALKTAAHKRRRKQVILVRGGPGTGKSVIALNALGEMLRQGLHVYLVSGSSAFTHGLRRILGKRLEGQVRFTDFFWDAAPDSIDCLVIDEAHRIRARSQPKVMGHLRPKVSQVEELIRAARVTLFFADENQIIQPDEVGEPAVIRETAKRMGAQFEEFLLCGQFRCNGSAQYLDWLDDMLELVPSEGIKLVTPTAFDFKVMDRPHDLLAEVMDRNAAKPNSSRLLAGWCWPWSDPLSDGLVDDIQIGDFRFPWESKNGKRPPAGIPEAKHWAIDPAGVGQAGTVYSVQGFEMQHVGVIVGPDLIVRNGRWVADPRKNFSNGLRAKPPDVALPYLKRIYRTLLSRATQSCSVFCVDEETRGYIASRIVRP